MAKTLTPAQHLFSLNVRSLTDDALTAAMNHPDRVVRKMAERESLRRERAAERFISWCMH